MRLLKSLWLKVIDRQVLQVYHHDSPGIRVFVRRNRFQRRFYDRTFSGVSEKIHYSLIEAFPGNLRGAELLRVSQTVVADFNRWLKQSGAR